MRQSGKHWYGADCRHGESGMLDWVGDQIFWLATYVPALFLAQDSPNFTLFRAMCGLFLIVLVVYIIALRPIRSAFARWRAKPPTG
jgi:hypothetical protein